MLATTNSNTQQTAQVFATVSEEDEYFEQLAMLGKKRIYVESRGIPAEYYSLANEYATIGATVNAENLRRKARALEA